MSLPLVAAAAGCRAGDAAPRAEGGAAGGNRASLDARDEASRLIEDARRQAVPVGNYRIEVQRAWLASSDVTTLGAIFAFADEHVAVQVGAPTARPGFRIGVLSGDARAMVTASLERSSASDLTTMQLLAAPGAPAELQVGEVRYTVPLDLGPAAGALVLPRGQFLGASLRVRASPAGPGFVSVALTPVFAGLGADGRSVALTELTSTVTARLGEGLLIASRDRESRDVASTLLSRRTATGSEQGVIVLTVTGG